MNLLGPMPSVEEFTGTLSALGAAILFNYWVEWVNAKRRARKARKKSGGQPMIGESDEGLPIRNHPENRSAMGYAGSIIGRLRQEMKHELLKTTHRAVVRSRLD